MRAAEAGRGGCDGGPGHRRGVGRRRRARVGGVRRGLGDITVLVPARTSLPFLEDALDGAGIPFRAESSSLVYASRAVRDLLMVLRAIDDPTNYLHIVSALRTPLLACGDDDLFRFKSRGVASGVISTTNPTRCPLDDPVRAALVYLRSLYDQRSWLAPSELLERISRDRRAMELGFAEGRPRDVWRRLRFVIDQARAWSEATGGNLRQYLRWVTLQTRRGAGGRVDPARDRRRRSAHHDHPQRQGTGVPHHHRLGNVHSRQSQSCSRSSGVPRPTGTVGYKFGGKVETKEYEAWEPIDEQMNFHERIRLLYVACTRARDHLVVSLHRKVRAAEPKATTRTNAELLLLGMDDLVNDLPDAALPVDQLPAVVLIPPAPPTPLEEWESELSEALERASRPTAVAATALTDEGIFRQRGRTGSRPAEAAPGHRPPPLAEGPLRDGRSVGPCTGPPDDRPVDRRRARPGGGGPVRGRGGAGRAMKWALVLQALESPSVREAAASPALARGSACTPHEGRLLEGYIDLLYRGADGLVVVDHKTAATSDPDEFDGAWRDTGSAGGLVRVDVGTSTAEPVAA